MSNTLFFQDQAHILEYVICDIGIMDKKRFPDKKAVEEQKDSLCAADLIGADLSEADLTEAYLPDANLSEANLKYADLRGECLNPFLTNITNYIF